MSAIVFVGTTYRTVAVFVVIISVLLIFPIVRYVVVGWKYKKEDITNSIGDSAKKNTWKNFKNSFWWRNKRSGVIMSMRMKQISYLLIYIIAAMAGNTLYVL